MKKGGYLANYNRKKEGKIDKSSSQSNLADSYVPKEQWKSKLKRAMIHKHVLENDSSTSKNNYQYKYKSPENRGEEII